MILILCKRHCHKNARQRFAVNLIAEFIITIIFSAFMLFSSKSMSGHFLSYCLKFYMHKQWEKSQKGNSANKKNIINSYLKEISNQLNLKVICFNFWGDCRSSFSVVR